MRLKHIYTHRHKIEKMKHTHTETKRNDWKNETHTHTHTYTQIHNQTETIEKNRKTQNVDHHFLLPLWVDWSYDCDLHLIFTAAL